MSAMQKHVKTMLQYINAWPKQQRQPTDTLRPLQPRLQTKIDPLERSWRPTAARLTSHRPKVLRELRWPPTFHVTIRFASPKAPSVIFASFLYVSCYTFVSICLERTVIHEFFAWNISQLMESCCIIWSCWEAYQSSWPTCLTPSWCLQLPFLEPT